MSAGLSGSTLFICAFAGLGDCFALYCRVMLRFLVLAALLCVCTAFSPSASPLSVRRAAASSASPVMMAEEGATTRRAFLAAFAAAVPAAANAMIVRAAPRKRAERLRAPAACMHALHASA